MRFTVSVAAIAATLVAATPAMAASSATATANARGIVLKSLSLSNTSDLDFGTVAADATNPGTVSVDADTGARATTGAVVALPGAFARGQFDGLGDPNANVTLNSDPAGRRRDLLGRPGLPGEHPGCPVARPGRFDLAHHGRPWPLHGVRRW